MDAFIPNKVVYDMLKTQTENNPLNKLILIRNQLEKYFMVLHHTEEPNEKFAFDIMYNFYKTVDKFLKLYVDENYLEMVNEKCKLE